tara:strand:+ start:619 stop:918 length:300 start_codon:yes stop_codon:yes gene_type:complete
MPAKFKPSEREYPKDARGRRMNTQVQVKKWKHHYLKAQSVETLLEAINSSRTKPKHRTKYRNELARRGIKTVYVVNGEQIERTQQALLDYARKNGGRFV